MSGDRKVGENFDADAASDIFDKLRNVEGKIKPKKEDSKLKNMANLMNEAKYLENKGELTEAVDLYKQVIFTLPDSIKAYESLANIYRKQGDVDSEKELLKKAIANCSKNDGFKKRLNEID
jgi:tetratricopeptide (TPR) repeat protein